MTVLISDQPAPVLDFDTDTVILPNDPKFSDRQVWANSVDPDQTVPS